MWYKNIAGIGSLDQSQSTRETDGGRTDGQNYDSQDRASIVASRGKNNHNNVCCRSQFCGLEVFQLIVVATTVQRACACVCVSL